MLDIICSPRRRFRSSGYRLALLLILLTSVVALPAEARDAWYPVQVEVWEPPFNDQRQRVEREYVPLERAAEPWRICLLIPHLKDSYWLAVNFAVVDEARRLGVSVAVFSAGGYDRLDRQRVQIDECLSQNPDGILLSAVSSDGLDLEIENAVARGVPVVDLINGISSPLIRARVGADFWDMGHATGAYLNALQSQRGTPVRIAWFPGPAGAGWVEASDAGLRDALDGQAVEVVTALNGDTGRSVQRGLVEAVLDQPQTQIDYVVGTAVTAEVGVTIIRSRGLKNQVGLLADYYSPAVHRSIRRGEIIAAPSDLPALQTRIALDVMVRILEQREFPAHVGAKVVMIDRERLATWDASSSLPPRGFRPVFNVDWQ
ncbi:MAG: TMAO reductase system periplasmic protein TorT [Gammaproteobacteria bacterium]